MSGRAQQNEEAMRKLTSEWLAADAFLEEEFCLTVTLSILLQGHLAISMKVKGTAAASQIRSARQSVRGVTDNGCF